MSKVNNNGNNISDLNAIKKWSQISSENRQLLLSNVFCSNCKITKIVDYTVQSDKYGIVLKGKCEKCGSDVARLIND